MENYALVILALILRYIQLKQFCASDVRIYRQSSKLEGDITMSEYVDTFEGFEQREGPITVEKVFRDIWELKTDKQEIKTKKKKVTKGKKVRVVSKQRGLCSNVYNS